MFSPTGFIVGVESHPNWLAHFSALSKALKNVWPNLFPPSIGMLLSAAPLTWNKGGGTSPDGEGEGVDEALPEGAHTA